MLQFDTPAQAARWLGGRVTGTLRSDSRLVREGDGFIAWPGAAVDGRQFVHAALRQGASACLVEREGVEDFDFDDPAVAAYPSLKAATGPVASLYFGQPSGQIDVLAVTGTNGKTSTAWWLAQALSNLDPAYALACGVVGTLGVGCPPDVEATGMTTPDPVLLQGQFRRYVDQGLRACAIEASSIGLAERRLDGTRIKLAVFTNFTHDHLDYHGSMEAYWRAKAELFSWPGLQAAVVNIDDPKGPEIVRALTGTAVDLWTVSSRAAARLQARDVGYSAQGLSFTVVEGSVVNRLQTGLVGQYNVSNLLGVLGAMRAVGVPLGAAVKACSTLGSVPGRMDCLALAGRPLVAIDYAHTPDALEKALDALRPLATQRNGRLWVVFGCGGDRDAAKRPLMGAVAQQNADRVVITSDNPRSEAPMAIIGDIRRGLSHGSTVEVEADRASAIALALEQAAAQDVVLLAGKGHEDYQETAGVRIPFSDKAQALSVLRGLTVAQVGGEGART
jgi:murE/murF fusion protein